MLCAAPARAQSLQQQAEPGARSIEVEGGLLVAAPAALPTGLSSGIDAGFLRGRHFAWGALVSWSSATEYTLTSSVTQDDFRLRVVGALQHSIGRGTVGLRLEPGGTLIHEQRTRDQASRAGLTGPEFNSDAWHLAPALDLEVAVTLRLIGTFGLAISGGPSLHWLDDGLSTGWVGTLGVAWLH